MTLTTITRMARKYVIVSNPGYGVYTIYGISNCGSDYYVGMAPIKNGGPYIR